MGRGWTKTIKGIRRKEMKINIVDTVMIIGCFIIIIFNYNSELLSLSIIIYFVNVLF